MSDLIRRKDAIDMLSHDICNNGLPYEDDYNIGINHAMCLLACVPTAERKLKGETKMKDRDCRTCVYARTPDDMYDNGCTAWECEYINRREAIEAYKEMHKNDKLQAERE